VHAFSGKHASKLCAQSAAVTTLQPYSKPLLTQMTTQLVDVVQGQPLNLYCFEFATLCAPLCCLHPHSNATVGKLSVAWSTSSRQCMLYSTCKVHQHNLTVYLSSRQQANKGANPVCVLQLRMPATLDSKCTGGCCQLHANTPSNAALLQCR
jgi:hypothetical protein